MIALSASLSPFFEALQHVVLFIFMVESLSENLRSFNYVCKHIDTKQNIDKYLCSDSRNTQTINTTAILNCQPMIKMHLFYRLDYVQLLFVFVLRILLPNRHVMAPIYYWTVQLHVITFTDAFADVGKSNFLIDCDTSYSK